MSMMESFVPDHGEQGGIPAADPGPGGPPPSEGFGVAGEEPDRADSGPGGDLDEQLGQHDPDGSPFRTPEPGQRG